MGPLCGPFATQGRSHKYATFRREDDLDCPQEAGHQSNPWEQSKYATLRREEDLWERPCVAIGLRSSPRIRQAD
ncbi:hypothetical protein KKK_10005 [Pseudomonas putida B6-2]|nr:hypothetical protein KKK_10005 [Pseudomonas putida B6-2]